MTNNKEAVDTSKIKIDITKLDESDYRIDFDMTAELVAEIYGRLKEGGYDYEEPQMTSLLTKMCLDEGRARFDKNSILGPTLMPETKPAKFNKDEPFVFSAIIDVVPTLSLQDLDSIPIQRQNLEISDDLIEMELFEQRLMFGTRESFSGELAYGDVITCSAALTVAGNDTPEVTIDNCKIPVPKEGHKLVINKFTFNEGEQLRGATAPGAISISLTDKQSKYSTLVLDVFSVERITPCDVDVVLKQYQTPTETLLRAQIKLSLQRNFDRTNDESMRYQLFNYLLENVTVPISSRIVESHLEKMCIIELEKNPEQSELDDETKSKIRTKAEITAKRRVITTCLQLLFNLSVNEEDVQKQICDIAENRRIRPEEVREEFVSSDRMSVIGNIAMEKKISHKLMDKMVFTDV